MGHTYMNAHNSQTSKSDDHVYMYIPFTLILLASMSSIARIALGLSSFSICLAGCPIMHHVYVTNKMVGTSELPAV